MTDAIIERLTVWVMFSVLLVLVPLLFDAGRAMIRGGSFSLDDAISRGELTLVTAAICGSAIGELFGVGGAAKLGKILAGGGALLTLMFCAFFYTEASAVRRAKAKIAKRTVRNLSIVGVLCSGLCVALSKVV